MIFTMAPSPYISLIFVNYQSAWPISLALKSLFSMEPERSLFEVIVINNDAAESRTLQRMAQLLPFRLIENDTNQGFGQGVNKAAVSASGTVIGLLNPDILWQEPSLSRLRDFFLKQETPAILGFRLLDEDGNEEAWSAGKAPRLASLFWDNIFQNFLPKKFSHDEPLDWVSGCGLFLPKSTFLDIGGFDERFFLYFEDVDLCVRAKKHGAIIVRDPRFVLVHSGGKSFATRSSQKKNYFLSQKSFFKKHRPSFEFLVISFLHRFLRNI